jgi:hypothetical protein
VKWRRGSAEGVEEESKSEKVRKLGKVREILR